MTDVSLTDLAVAIGRVEEGQRAMKESIDRLVDGLDEHDDTLGGHESRLAVLEAARAPRIHWITIVVGIIAIAGFGLAIFDRLYK